MCDVVLAVPEGSRPGSGETAAQVEQEQRSSAICGVPRRERCRGRYTAKELAHRLDRISISGLGKAHGRIKAHLKKDPALREHVRQVHLHLGAKFEA